MCRPRHTGHHRAYDDPGPTGKPYTEPTRDPVRGESFDLTLLDNAAASHFLNIELAGDFFNAVGYALVNGKMNMALNFDNATVTGVILIVLKAKYKRHENSRALVVCECPEKLYYYGRESVRADLVHPVDEAAGAGTLV